MSNISPNEFLKPQKPQNYTVLILMNKVTKRNLDKKENKRNSKHSRKSPRIEIITLMQQTNTKQK